MLEHFARDDVRRMRAISKRWMVMKTHIEAILERMNHDETKEEIEYYMKMGISPFEAYKEAGGDSD